MVAWALWDCGATGLNAMVVTFVFSVYLTSRVGVDQPGGTSPTSWLGRALFVAGVVVAMLAPVTGVWVDEPHRRRRALAVLSGAGVLLSAAMSLIRDDPRYLLPGLVLLAATAACSDLASVPYNAMLRRLATPQTAGRVSGIGLGAGYAGTVLLLLVAYVGFSAGGRPDARVAADSDGRRPERPGRDAADRGVAAGVRASRLDRGAAATRPRTRPCRGVRRVPQVVVGCRRRMALVRATWWYSLLASAVFRDGLTGVFTFGAVLGVGVYGISDADVLLFGMSACGVAAVGAVLGGLLDDRVGSKPVIIGSLAAMIAVALTLLTLSGPIAFWICGLLLTLFIGPTLSSARTLLLRMTRHGKEGVAFGLYTTVGRAVSFLAPWMFFTFVDIFGTDRAGMGGLIVVLALGLLLMALVRTKGATTFAAI